MHIDTVITTPVATSRPSEGPLDSDSGGPIPSCHPASGRRLVQYRRLISSSAKRACGEFSEQPMSAGIPYSTVVVLLLCVAHFHTPGADRATSAQTDWVWVDIEQVRPHIREKLHKIKGH